MKYLSKWGESVLMVCVFFPVSIKMYLQKLAVWCWIYPCFPPNAALLKSEIFQAFVAPRLSDPLLDWLEGAANSAGRNRGLSAAM